MIALAATEAPNTLVLFQGDQIRHRVRPMADRGERIVISMRLGPEPVRSKNPVMRAHHSWVNWVFYRNPRA